jgi:hypothetical protein
MSVVETGLPFGGSVARSLQTIQQSVQRIAASFVMIDRAHARLLPAFAGGADVTREQHVNDRIRELIATNGTTVGIYGGRVLRVRKCDLCGYEILPGGVEYEICFETHQVFMDRRCFAAFMSHATAT